MKILPDLQNRNASVGDTLIIMWLMAWNLGDGEIF